MLRAARRAAPEAGPPAAGRVLALLLAVAMLAVGGCGGDSEGGTGGEVEGVGEVKAGSVAPLAQCRDWNAGDEDERLATIEEIRSQTNLEDAAVEVPTLSDDQAYELFEATCSRAFAAGFRLYKVYAQGAAFSPLAEP